MSETKKTGLFGHIKSGIKTAIDQYKVENPNGKVLNALHTVTHSSLADVGNGIVSTAKKAGEKISSGSGVITNASINSVKTSIKEGFVNAKAGIALKVAQGALKMLPEDPAPEKPRFDLHDNFSQTDRV